MAGWDLFPRLETDWGSCPQICLGQPVINPDRNKRLRDQQARMQKEIHELKKGKHRKSLKKPLVEMNASFSRKIREAELLPKFKMLGDKYFGTEDPLSHMESFVQQMKCRDRDT
ncbi:hypothetical protein Ddye_016369 [Dipteronia dyeriana]|uniref:Uncharacterized protein n=1 Tax=Dipteronia dyeriana TaxID=168575 RepID=A0AAD9U7F5_9ROSI|nr:hypothetical protein Ddye_016369 [Dipteronia dyeriana]